MIPPVTAVGVSDRGGSNLNTRAERLIRFQKVTSIVRDGRVNGESGNGSIISSDLDETEISPEISYSACILTQGDDRFRLQAGDTVILFRDHVCYEGKSKEESREINMELAMRLINLVREASTGSRSLAGIPLPDEPSRQWICITTFPRKGTFIESSLGAMNIPVVRIVIPSGVLPLEEQALRVCAEASKNGLSAEIPPDAQVNVILVPLTAQSMRDAGFSGQV